jgi:hypothetical protein
MSKEEVLAKGKRTSTKRPGEPGKEEGEHNEGNGFEENGTEVKRSERFYAR